MSFLPITGPIMEIASELWATVRRAGLPTAGENRLDGDAILAATTLAEAGSADEIIGATSNVGHLGRFPGIDAREWWAGDLW